MPVERLHRDELESRWQRNEGELNRIAGMNGLDREMHASHAETLQGEQDEIEFRLGSPARAGSRRWSGMP
jgi:hypothetical protein